MKLCKSCNDEDILICDWCTHAPPETAWFDDGNFYCEEFDEVVSWIDPACDLFECFMRPSDEPKQGGLF